MGWVGVHNVDFLGVTATVRGVYRPSNLHQRPGNSHFGERTIGGPIDCHSDSKGQGMHGPSQGRSGGGRTTPLHSTVATKPRDQTARSNAKPGAEDVPEGLLAAFPLGIAGDNRAIRRLGDAWIADVREDAGVAPVDPASRRHASGSPYTVPGQARHAAIVRARRRFGYARRSMSVSLVTHALSVPGRRAPYRRRSRAAPRPAGANLPRTRHCFTLPVEIPSMK